MRLYGITWDEVSEIISPSNGDGVDQHGNLRYTGKVRGLSICVILAHDDRTTVITVYDLEA
ncbi:MAG TPA: hypothetical protein VIY71_10245 [Solirubrobacterales bacterium]